MSSSNSQFRIEDIAGSLCCCSVVENCDEKKKLAVQIVHQGLAERFGEDYDPNFNHDLKNLDESYLIFSAMFSSDNEMVGTGALSLEPFTSELVENCETVNETENLSNLERKKIGNEYCLRVGRVSILEKYRRKGLAIQIMKYLISKASELYVKLKEDESKVIKRWLVVETDTPWIEAVELYKKLNFIIVCERDGCTHFKKEIEI